ncbi:MAG: hypothetical protein VX833_05895 [Actinomycetota bacterium]|nr:hypothetical protein [Actinomycetota bacterium]
MTEGAAYVPTTWSVQARNLPEHARNPIHTDVGARAAGFSAAIVPGVTVYAYLTRPVVDAWTVRWLQRGGALVEFASPVYADDLVDCVPSVNEGHLEVQATVSNEVRAKCTAWLTVPDAIRPVRSFHEPLESESVTLVNEWADYGQRAGEDLGLYAELGIVHPAVWPALANYAVERQLVNGPWIHVRSRILHHGTAAVGATADVDAIVVDRFDTRVGSRVILDVSVSVDGKQVATIEHEAIIALHPAAKSPSRSS